MVFHFSFVNEELSNFLFQLRQFHFLPPLFSFLSPILPHLFLLPSFALFLFRKQPLPFIFLLNHGSMRFLHEFIGLDDHLLRQQLYRPVFLQEATHLLQHPWQHTLIHTLLYRRHHHALVLEGGEGAFFETHEVLLGCHAGDVLHVGGTTLFFAGALLNFTPIQLLLATQLSSLHPLGFDQLSITNLLVLLRLLLHNFLFFFF
mmetsp:Transcript_48204/g.35387  ORF Transcript_48204/g.35387 Transcript_48204/m.35387 type:complete len:203 (-) Transcript_48204:347-955(-)